MIGTGANESFGRSCVSVADHLSERRCGPQKRRPAAFSFDCGRTTPANGGYLSRDHDPLYRFHQWQANLRILNIREIKTVPYVPRSHPVIERLIGTVRRECLDRLLFWTAADLERKLVGFRASLRAYRWQMHCRGLYHTPRAA